MKDYLNYKKPRFWLFLSLIFGLTTRVLYLSWYAHNVIFFKSPVGFSRIYNELSSSLIYIDVFDERFLYLSPLYALFVASVRFMFEGLAWVYFFQALLGIGNIILTYIAARGILDEKRAALAAWIYALTPAFLFYESKLCPLTLALSLILILVISLRRIFSANDFASWGIAGISLALLCFVYPQYFYIFLACFAILAFMAGKRILNNKLRAAFGILLFLLASLPFYIWYGLITDRFIPLPKSLGVHFYLNNPLSEERSFVRTNMDMVEPGFFTKASKFAADDSRSVIKPQELPGYLAGKKIETIKRNPLVFMRSCGGKFLSIFSPKVNSIEASFHHESEALSLFLLFIPLALIITFGLFFISISKIDTRDRILHLSLALGALISYCFLNALEDGKALIAVALIPFFASGIYFLFRDPGKKKAKIYVGIVGLTFLLSFIILFQNGRSFSKDPRLSFNFALAYHATEDYKNALKNYGDVLDMEPSNFNALNGASIAALTGGSIDEARSILLKGIEKYPRYADFHNNLGLVYMRSKEYGKSESQFLKAFESDPNHGYALYNLGYLFREMDRLDEALKYLKRVPNWSQVYPKSLSLTAAIYAEKGQIKRSLELYRKVQKLLKDNPYYDWKIEQLENELKEKK